MYNDFIMRNKYKVIAIAAIGKNRELGYKNKLLWNIPTDLKHFKETTRQHPVIMGDKTYESLPQKPLPGRTNIIMTLNKNFYAPKALLAHSPEEALTLAKKAPGSDKIFIIGGGTIYKIMLPFTNELNLTLVNDSPKADVFFPEFTDQFKLIEKGATIIENAIKFQFAKFYRK